MNNKLFINELRIETDNKPHQTEIH